MKRMDIKPGMEVAVSGGYRLRRVDLGEQVLLRARVETVGEPEPEYEGQLWSQRQSAHKRIVKVTLLSGGHKTGEVGYYEPREVLAIWADYEVAVAEHADYLKRRDAYRREREETHERSMNELVELLRELGLDELADLPMPEDRGATNEATVTLTASQVAELVEAVRAKTSPGHWTRAIKP